MKLFFDGSASVARDPEFIARVRDALDLTGDVALEFAEIKPGAASELRYRVTLPVQISGADFGAADGVYVDEAAAALLVFDARGALMSFQVQIADEKHLRSVQAQIKKLAAADAIYAASPDEAIDSAALIALNKPWVVSADAAGRKRLKRAFIA